MTRQEENGKCRPALPGADGGKGKPELLVPAGGPALLKIAVRYGADAVYFGGEAFGLRAAAKNFTENEMAEGIVFAHAHGVKAYVTANIIAHDRDIAEAEAYFEVLKALAPDGLIIADPGMFMLAKRICPGIAIHVSTQANSTNTETCRFWHDLGAKRIVPARELTLAEIASLKAALPKAPEIECFVHGAMCMSYSGRCMLSAALSGRSANEGACTHPCRWKYAVVEEQRPGEYMPVVENERGTFIFSSRDLCMIEHIPALIGAGIDSFKIEGRMKNALYVAAVSRTYRQAIDAYLRDPAEYEAQKAAFVSALKKCTHRPYSTGFYFDEKADGGLVTDGSTYESGAVYLGFVEESGMRCLPETLREAAVQMIPESGGSPDCGNAGMREADRDKPGVFPVRITQRNKFTRGETVFLMKPDGRDLPAKVLAIAGADGMFRESAPHAKEVLFVWLEISGETGEAPALYDVLYGATGSDKIL